MSVTIFGNLYTRSMDLQSNGVWLKTFTFNEVLVTFPEWFEGTDHFITDAAGLSVMFCGLISVVCIQSQWICSQMVFG
jgi:hypothetical protein